jgi:hypothetical protein
VTDSTESGERDAEIVRDPNSTEHRPTERQFEQDGARIADLLAENARLQRELRIERSTVEHLQTLYKHRCDNAWIAPFIIGWFAGWLFILAFAVFST